MARTPLGDVMDRMGVSADLRPDDHVTDVVVLLKVQDEHGDVTVVIEHSENTGWYDQRALVNAAAAVVERADLRRR